MLRALAAGPLALVLTACAAPDRDASSPAAPDTVPAAPASSGIRFSAGTDGSILASWLEPRGSGHVLRFATRRGRAWQSARDAAIGEDWVVHASDLASVVPGTGGVLAAAWLVKSGPDAWSYGVRCAVSTDDGASWSPPATPHRDDGGGEHGFATVVPAAGGTFDVVWLDGRDVEGGGGTALRHATLSRDGVFGEETRLDERACDCCPTDAARTADGTLVVVYRDRSPDEIRDISVLRHDSLDGWSEPRGIATDGWRIHGCPVNGPAVAAEGNVVACAWFTMADGAPATKVAFSADGGRTFESPIRFDDGDPLGYVDAALLPEGEAVVTWLEKTAAGRELRVRRVGRSGRDVVGRPRTIAAAPVEGELGLPRLARSGPDLWIGWVESGEPGTVRVTRFAAGSLGRP